MKKYKCPECNKFAVVWDYCEETNPPSSGIEHYLCKNCGATFEINNECENEFDYFKECKNRDNKVFLCKECDERKHKGEFRDLI